MHVQPNPDFNKVVAQIPVGREDNDAPTYGNDDLPNLRAAVTADLIGPITCTPPGVPAGTMLVNVALLDGRVYPEFRKQDRRARVYLIAFLKQK